MLTLDTNIRLVLSFIARMKQLLSFLQNYALDTRVYVHTHSPPPEATIIGIPTYESPNIYTVAFKDGSLSEYTEDLLSLAPVPLSSPEVNLLPSWLKGGGGVPK